MPPTSSGSAVDLVGVFEPTIVERDCVDLALLTLRVAAVAILRYFSEVWLKALRFDLGDLLILRSQSARNRLVLT